MPTGNDVRWSFSLDVDHCLTTPPDNRISGYISINSIQWEIYEEYIAGDFHFHFEDTLPGGWTMEYVGYDSYKITTDNLSNYFLPGQSITVDFRGGYDCSDSLINNPHFDYITFNVDNVPIIIIPEPGTLLLFGLGSFVLFRRRTRAT